MRRTIFCLMLSISVLIASNNVCSGQAAYEYLSPLPGSDTHLPETTIILRYGEVIASPTLSPIPFEVKGSLSGNHPGQLVLSDDKKTMIFKPDQPFSRGERVEVSVRQGVAALDGTVYGPLAFSFSIAPEGYAAPRTPARNPIASWAKAFPSALSRPRPSAGLGQSGYLTLPPDFPDITVTTSAQVTAEGYLFFASLAFGSDQPGAYSIILDNQGEPVYFQKGMALDFKKLADGRLAYFQNCAYTLMNASYQVEQVIQAGNGYGCIDMHDLQLLPDGHFAFLIYFNRAGIDLRPWGGIENATVTELVIQEVDSLGNVVFEWRSWDPGHFSYGDTADFISLTSTNPIDYIHANAIELDGDGHFLISSRNLNEITKINRQNGAIIWRWGGKQNQFAFDTSLPTTPDNGLEFYCQHDIRRLLSGRVSLFDNHNAGGGAPPYSRVLEYELNETGIPKTATLVREIRNTPDTVSWFMGNGQSLPNGNTLVGWGSSPAPFLTEFTPEGGKALEMTLGPPLVSYRAYRFPWHGHPTWTPALVLTTQDRDTKLSFSWNGATEIATYEIYGGSDPFPRNRIASKTKTAFEDTLLLQGDDARHCTYRILPIDTLGRPTRFSEPVANPACGYRHYLPLISG